MAVYKVPQDVEAEDKLIGPLSFRQFIYIMIAAAGIAVGYGLYRLFPPLAVIPVPLILFFGILGFPLKKDQPMEIYLAAIVSFYLKPRRRLWQADGIQSLVEITAPKEIESQLTKTLSENEARQRLSYLADIADTGGWSVRGIQDPYAQQPGHSVMNTDAYNEAQKTEDRYDQSSGVSRHLDEMIAASDTRHRQAIKQQIENNRSSSPATTPVVNNTNDDTTINDTTQTDDPIAAFLKPHAGTPDPFRINPYPSQIKQKVIQPLTSDTDDEAYQKGAEPIEPTSKEQVSPDIINLASNTDLSIETIQHEADRLSRKSKNLHQLPDDEVIIPLR